MKTLKMDSYILIKETGMGKYLSRLTSFCFYFSIGLLPIGMLFRMSNWSGGVPLFTFGIFGISVYFLASIMKSLIQKRNERIAIPFKVILVIMSIVIYSKYLYHPFSDYLTLVTVPLFIFSLVWYYLKSKIKDKKIAFTFWTFFAFSIPLFGLDFYKAPRQFIPQEWYNRYDISSSHRVTLPYQYLYPETEKLGIKAFDLNKAQEYKMAITIFKEARQIEPKNPKLLFGMSESYARINDLETAIELLDSAILIDNESSIFYNNRGLLHYKLIQNEKAISDFKKAIQIDSTEYLHYANIALAYYFNKSYDESCQSILKAQELGYDISKEKIYKRIIRQHCKMSL